MEDKYIVMAFMWLAWGYSTKHLGFFSIIVAIFMCMTMVL